MTSHPLQEPPSPPPTPHLIGLFCRVPPDRRLISSFLHARNLQVLAPDNPDQRDVLQQLRAAMLARTSSLEAGASSANGSGHKSSNGAAAPSSPEAWRPVSLIIADVQAATQLGTTLTSIKSTAEAYYLPILIILPHAADAAPWLERGFDDVLRAPITKAELHARLRVFLQLREHSDRVRRIASELTLAEQRDRQRLADSLHDDLQQQLFAIQLRADMLARRMAHLGDDEPLTAPFGALRAHVEKAIRTTRRLAVDQSPPVLEGEGLDRALSWLALHLKERFGLTVDLHADPGVSVPHEAMRVLLFQFVRTLLLNVVQHAEVLRVRVDMQDVDGQLHISVRDEGVGFTQTVSPDNLDPNHHIALYSINERLKLFGGTLTIQTSPNEGTTATISVPLLSL